MLDCIKSKLCHKQDMSQLWKNAPWGLNQPVKFQGHECSSSGVKGFNVKSQKYYGQVPDMVRFQIYPGSKCGQVQNVIRFQMWSGSKLGQVPMWSGSKCGQVPNMVRFQIMTRFQIWVRFQIMTRFQIWVRFQIGSGSKCSQVQMWSGSKCGQVPNMARFQM